MRFLQIVRLPHEQFNAAVLDGTAGKKLEAILKAIKPEATYFTEIDGERCAIVVVDLPKASAIPSLAEPWFLTFGADVQFHPAMLPEDLQKAGLDKLAKQWS